MSGYVGTYGQAREDGIRRDERGRFIMPCVRCGGDVVRTQYSRKRIYVCDACKKAEKSAKRKAEEAKDTRTKEEKRFDSAVQKLKKQGIDKSWDSAIEIAKKRIDRYESVPEVMMAIGLIHYKYAIIPQQKVGSLTVDFALPKIKVIVEVDGSIYHKKAYKENHRDYRLRNLLGMDWEVRYVPAEEVEKDINHAIEFFVNKQKQPYSGDNKLF